LKAAEDSVTDKKRQPPKMQIRIKTLTGKEIEIDIDPEDEVR
jgi:hypothetical protein